MVICFPVGCLGMALCSTPSRARPAGLGRLTAPLFEEERYFGPGAVIPDVVNPLGPHRPSLWAALAPDDNPGYPFELKGSRRALEAVLSTGNGR